MRAAFEVYESWTIRPASMFKTVNWKRVVVALLDLSLSLRPMPDGITRLGIKGYGTHKISIERGKAHATRSDAPAGISLDHRTATQLLLGPLPPASLLRLSESSPLASWFPLPLSWNGQDRA